MVTGPGTWIALLAFAATLVGLVVVTGVTRRPARAPGPVAGCATAGLWIVVGILAVSERTLGAACPAVYYLTAQYAPLRSGTHTIYVS
jgi:hypothetical protein